MKLFILPINVLILYVAATSAAATGWFSKDPDHPGKCVIKNQNLVLSPGEYVYGWKSCNVTLCKEGAFVETYSCGVLFVPEGCKIVKPVDPTGTYPNCCSAGVICNDISKE